MVFIDFSRCDPPKIHPKSMPKQAPKKHRKKSLPKMDFGFHFGLPNPPKIASKSAKIPPQTEAARSLFRDAMGLTRKSSEVNGGHSL